MSFSVSSRMKLFVDSALPNLAFWDMCCDHGYIGLYALQTNLFTEIHFVDQVPEIISKLKDRIDKSNQLKSHHKIYFYSQDASSISDVVDGNILIAGVGGSTMIKILSGLSNSYKLNANRILLSPHLEEDLIVSYMNSKQQYFLQQKIEFKERHRVRSLYVFDKNTNL